MRLAGRSLAGMREAHSLRSIGTTALRVLARQRERFHVAALTAFSNAALLAEQAAEFRPGYVGLVRNGDEGAHPGWAASSQRICRVCKRRQGTYHSPRHPRKQRDC